MSATPTPPNAADARSLRVEPEEFDALAELFLGDDAETEPPAPPPAPAPARAPAGPLDAARSAAGPSDPPIRMVPAPEADAAEPEDARRGMRGGGAASRIEALIMGHLPVRSAPWPSQYARTVAERMGAPVALLRHLGDHLAIDLYGVPDDARSAHEQAGIGGAIAHVAAIASRWILHVDGIDEPALLLNRHVGSVTLLAGANEAAVVAAYRTVKGMTAAPPADPDMTPPSIRVAIVGAEAAAASAAGHKLARAASIFLDESIELAEPVGKVRPAFGASVLRMQTDLPAATILARVAAAIGEEAPATASDADDDGAFDLETAEMPRPAAPAPVPAPAAAPTPLEPTTDDRAIPVEPVPMAPPEPGEPATRLAQHVAGLRPLAITCPDDEGVELAADGEGTLHLLLEDADETAVERLTAVEAWAAKHRRLIAMAAGDASPVDATRPVQMHLLTPRPRAVRHLLDARIHLHLLAEVRVNGSAAWFCTELN